MASYNESQQGEEVERSFRNKLAEIASKISEAHLSYLLFACKDVIPDAARETITESGELFLELEQRRKLSPNDKVLLCRLLSEIGLDKLSQDLEEFGSSITAQDVQKIENLKKQGRIAFKEGKYPEARSCYNNALSVLSSRTQDEKTTRLRHKILHQRMRCFIKQQNFKEAQSDCIEVLSQVPEDMTSKLYLAESLLGLKEYDRAMKEMEVLIKAKPRNPDVLLLYKRVQSILKVKEPDRNTPTLPPENNSIKLGDSYPRKILLVCDKWSGWHLDIYTVNRHLCRSFAKMRDIQVGCLVLKVSDKDKCKASRDGVYLIEAACRSGIPEGDTRLLFMHDHFPFDPDLVIGHGMITGVEAAEIARKLKCKYLQVFYDPPEKCKTRTQFDSAISLTETEKEIELGNSADFVVAIGPQVAEEWSNLLKRHVIEVIPGLTDCSSRNSVATLHRRCVIMKTETVEHHSQLNFVANAFNDCRKRGKTIRVEVQGTPRAKKADLQGALEYQLNRSSFDVHVTSFDASMEFVEGEIRVASLVLMPEPSESFGLRCLEAFSAGVPALVSNSLGIAHLLLKYFDEKFWKFLCPVEDEDDYELWSERIDDMLDEREKYFDLAADLKKQWNKKFTWDSAANTILAELSKSRCFTKRRPKKGRLDNPPSASLCSVEAGRFVAEEVDLKNKRRKLILIVSPTDCSKVSSIRHLANIPWIAVFYFDVNSAMTGYLASCEKVANEIGMKICRIIPPTSEESKQKVTLPNGIPWFLLEGTLESKRSMSDSLEWLRNIFVAVENSYHLPITMLILWDTSQRTRNLAKNLVKLLHIVEASSLKKQIKLAVVIINGEKPTYFEDIEEDWKTTVHFLTLEDFCNGINWSVIENPPVDESLDFTLPIASDPDECEDCRREILPPDLRWINAELEVLYYSVGTKPVHEGNDAQHFYRGGTISWYALDLGHAIERVNWEPIKAKIDELLPTAGTLRYQLPHQRGTGGTTSARKILFDYHKRYPCVTVTSISHAETAPAIKVLADFCKLPVIVLIDCKHVQGEEFDLEMLYNNLSNYRVPSIILEVVHKHGKSCGKELLYAAETLNQSEKEHFVEVYSDQKKEKLSRLRQLKATESEELQIPFYYALVTFEEKFIALEPFVRDCLAKSDKQQRQVLVFLAMAHHYGHISVPETILTSYFNAPCGTILEEVLTKISLQLLIEENGKWRPRHDLICLKILQSLLTYQDSALQARIHPDNWLQNIAYEAINFISHMPETLVSCLLLNRGITEEKYPDCFSPLINDIPEDDDAIRVFEKAIDSFPDNMFFKVHLGRLYSIKKKAGGFEMAIKYTDEGIDCADGEVSRVVRGQFAQMKGVVHSRQVSYLIRQEAEINDIVDIAEMGVKWFRRAVSICPDMVDGYIPEVSMMCKLFEYVDRVTGSIHDFLLSVDCHPFIVDGISQTADTLESVPDSENYSYWKTRLLCLGLRKRKTEMSETLKLLCQLRESGRASRGPINRKIADMKMSLCKQSGKSLSTIASEVIELLNEALVFDKPNEKESTMRLWVRIAPFVPVNLEDAENLIFRWCTEEKSVRSYLFKYIIACIHVIERANRYYSDIMHNANHDLNNAIKAINRGDVGRVRHPDRPIIWLGPPSRDMSQLVYLNSSDSVSRQKRLKNVLPHEHTQKLRQLTGTITRTDPKLGNISVGETLNVNFRTDLCDPPLTSATFNNRKVKFFLGFNFFGVDAFNVELID